MRETKAKNLMKYILENSQTPVSVPEIIDSFKVLKISVNKTTIYRELESLMNQGLILELDFGEGKKRYELNKNAHHHHLICEKCNRVEHIDLNEVELALAGTTTKVSEQHKFKITGHAIELFGLCGRCE